jgi:myosin heavy subunit
MAHIYEVGTRAWQPDPTEGWLASEVKEKLVDGEKVQLVFEVENGEVGALNNGNRTVDDAQFHMPWRVE